MIRKIVKPQLFFISLIIFIAGCSTTQKQARKTAQNEALAMQVQEDPEFYDKLAARNTRSTRGILMPMTGKVVSLAKGAILNFIKKEEKRFTKTYRQAQSDLFFYNRISQNHALDPAGMQFDGIEVARYKTDAAGRRDTTFFASFAVDTSQAFEILNNSIFRLKLKELQVKGTELPLVRRWYLPWTWFDKPTDTINLDVSIKVFASWVDENREMKRDEPIGEFYLVLRNVPLSSDDTYNEYIKSKEGTQLSGYSYLVPRSISFQKVGNRVEKIYGHGMYSLEVDIVESRKRGAVSKTATNVIEKSGALN